MRSLLKWLVERIISIYFLLWWYRYVKEKRRYETIRQHRTRSEDSSYQDDTSGENGSTS